MSSLWETQVLLTGARFTIGPNIPDSVGAECTETTVAGGGQDGWWPGCLSPPRVNVASAGSVPLSSLVTSGS